MTESDLSLTLHATTVAWRDQGLLITGPSSSGKSGLALSLLAFGCDLVADDISILTRQGGDLVATCPPAIRGLIEARHVGILGATPVDSAVLCLCVDLAQAETDRLPPLRAVTYLGVVIPLVHKTDTCHFAAAVLQYLKSGRRS